MLISPYKSHFGTYDRTTRRNGTYYEVNKSLGTYSLLECTIWLMKKAREGGLYLSQYARSRCRLCLCLFSQNGRKKTKERHTERTNTLHKCRQLPSPRASGDFFLNRLEHEATDLHPPSHPITGVIDGSETREGIGMRSGRETGRKEETLDRAERSETRRWSMFPMATQDRKGGITASGEGGGAGKHNKYCRGRKRDERGDWGEDGVRGSFDDFFDDFRL